MREVLQEQYTQVGEVTRREFFAKILSTIGTVSATLNSTTSTTEKDTAECRAGKAKHLSPHRQTIESIYTPAGVTVKLDGVPCLTPILKWEKIPDEQDEYFVRVYLSGSVGCAHCVQYQVDGGSLSSPPTTGAHRIRIRSGETLTVHCVGLDASPIASVVSHGGVQHLISITRPFATLGVESFKRGEYCPDKHGNPTKHLPNTILYLAEFGLQALQNELGARFKEYVETTDEAQLTLDVGKAGCREMARRMGAFVMAAQADADRAARGSEAGNFRMSNKPDLEDIHGGIPKYEDIDFTIRCPAKDDGELVVPLNASEAEKICYEGLMRLCAKDVTAPFFLELMTGIMMRYMGEPNWDSINDQKRRTAPTT